MSELKLIIEKEVILVDRRFMDLSKTIKDIVELIGSDEIPIEQEQTNITKAQFKKVYDYCLMHDFKPPSIKRPIKSEKLEQNVCEKDYKYIKDYDIFGNNQLRELLDVVKYFQIQSLYDLIICRISTEYYFGQDQDGFDNLKKKFNVKKDLTIDEEKKLKTEYPWIIQY